MGKHPEDKPASDPVGDETLPATDPTMQGLPEHAVPSASDTSGVDQTIAAPSVAPPARRGDEPGRSADAASVGEMTERDLRQISGLEATIHSSSDDSAAAHTLPSADQAVPRTAPSVALSQDTLTAEHPGRYEWRDHLGAGGIGEVALALDRHLGREVAVKELRRELASTGGSSSGAATRTVAEVRFLDEARVTARLEHPGVVPIYELGKHADDTLYYTMKVVRGQTLHDAMAGRDLAGRLTLLPHFIAVCDAVAYAHSHGVVHRDLKPANVMLGDFGETVVLDWGLAKVQGSDDEPESVSVKTLAELASGAPTAETVAGAPIGTPAYMAPEQARGALSEIDARSDVYALGAMLYELLTGRTPFVGRSLGELLSQVLLAPLVPTSDIEKRCPPELEAVALRALQRDRDRRYADARELAADVRAFQTGGLVGAHRYSAAALLARWVRRHRASLIATLVVALAVGGAWWYRGHALRAEREAAERARQAALLREVNSMLDEAVRGSGQTRWFDTYAFKLVSMKEPVVEKRLIAAIAHPNKQVRSLVARVLGGMRSERAVNPLVQRLRERGGEPEEEVLIEVINALGLIGDARADGAVDRARWRYPQHGHVWKSTELAYRMLPIPPLVNGGAGLSANEWTDRGRSLDNKGKTREALKAYDRAIALDDKLVRAYVNRGIVRKRLGDTRGALHDYDRALALDPKVAAARHNRATVKRVLGDYEGAIKDLDEVIAAGKYVALSLRNRALIKRHVGDLSGAVEDARAAIKAQPRASSGYKVLGNILYHMNDGERALGAFERALAINPDDAWVLLYRAAAQWMLGDRKAALSSLDRAVAVDPSNLTCWGNRAALRFELGDPGAAKADLDRCIELDPEDGRRWIQRGVIYYAQRGEMELALKDVLHGVKLGKGDTLFRGRLFALALAARLGRAQRTKALVRALGAETISGWHAQLGRVAAARAPLQSIAKEAQGNPEKLCDLALVTGVISELAGDREAARSAYVQAAAAKRPAYRSCVLARALSASEPRGLGGVHRRE